MSKGKQKGEKSFNVTVFEDTQYKVSRDSLSWIVTNKKKANNNNYYYSQIESVLDLMSNDYIKDKILSAGLLSAIMDMKEIKSYIKRTLSETCQEIDKEVNQLCQNQLGNQEKEKPQNSSKRKGRPSAATTQK